MIFRQVQASRRIIALRHVFLYCSWQLVLWWCLLDLSPWGCLYPSFYISTCLFYIYFYGYNYLCHGEHIMVFWNLLDGGPSHNGPQLGPSESLWDGTLGTNPCQQLPSAWQVSRHWVIWIFLVIDEFAEYSISGTKYSGTKLLSAFSPNWSNRGTI
jgi:hypothetical protein